MGLTTTFEERLEEVERELKMREKVYPQWVKAGKIKREIADRRIRLFKELAQELREQLSSKTGEQANLFG